MKVINGRDDIIKSELRAIKQNLLLPRLNDWPEFKKMQSGI